MSQERGRQSNRLRSLSPPQRTKSQDRFRTSSRSRSRDVSSFSSNSRYSSAKLNIHNIGTNGGFQGPGEYRPILEDEDEDVTLEMRPLLPVFSQDTPINHTAGTNNTNTNTLYPSTSYYSRLKPDNHESMYLSPQGSAVSKRSVDEAELNQIPLHLSEQLEEDFNKQFKKDSNIKLTKKGSTDNKIKKVLKGNNLSLQDLSKLNNITWDADKRSDSSGSESDLESDASNDDQTNTTKKSSSSQIAGKRANTDEDLLNSNVNVADEIALVDKGKQSSAPSVVSDSIATKQDENNKENITSSSKWLRFPGYFSFGKTMINNLDNHKLQTKQKHDEEYQLTELNAPYTNSKQKDSSLKMISKLTEDLKQGKSLKKLKLQDNYDEILDPNYRQNLSLSVTENQNENANGSQNEDSIYDSGLTSNLMKLYNQLNDSSDNGSNAYFDSDLDSAHSLEDTSNALSLRNLKKKFRDSRIFHSRDSINFERGRSRSRSRSRSTTRNRSASRNRNRSTSRGRPRSDSNDIAKKMNLRSKSKNRITRSRSRNRFNGNKDANLSDDIPDFNLPDFTSDIANNKKDKMSKKVKKIKKKSERHKKARITVHIVDLIHRQEFLLKLCKAFMLYGAPNHRLEEYMTLTAKILEIEATFIYLPGMMLANFSDPVTRTSDLKLVRVGQGLNLNKLDLAHDIYEQVVYDRIGVDEAMIELDDLLTRKDYLNTYWVILLYALSSTFVVVFYGGSWLDMGPSFVLGGLLGFLQCVVAPKNQVYSSVFEIGAAILISFIARAIGSINDGKFFCFSALVLSGLCMILPGYMILRGALEIQSKSIVSGVVGMFYAIIYSLFLGFGLTLGSALYGWIDKNATTHTTCVNMGKIGAIWQILLIPLYNVFMALACQAKPHQLSIMLAISCSGYVVTYFSSLHFGLTQFNSALGSFTIGLLTSIYDMWFRKFKSIGHCSTKFTSMICGVFDLVPGGFAARNVLSSGLLQLETSTNSSSTASTTIEESSLGFGSVMIEIAIGITVGLFMSTVVIYPLSNKHDRAGVSIGL